MFRYIVSTGAAKFSGDIVLGDNVKVIESNAFRDNDLTSVTIGSGVTSISSTAFYLKKTESSSSWSNPNLTQITINKPCADIKNMSGYPFIGTTPSGFKISIFTLSLSKESIGVP